MLKLIQFLLPILFLSLQSYADVACNSNEMLDEIMNAVVRKDEKTFIALMNTGHCIMTDKILEKKLHYSVVKQGLARSSIRVFYHNGDSEVFYVSTEFVRDHGVKK